MWRVHVPPPTLPGKVAATLSVIAERQFGIVTRADLARAGVSRHVVAAQLVAQRWRALGATVIALHNGPLSRVQQWSAAVLAAEGPVGLAGRTPRRPPVSPAGKS